MARSYHQFLFILCLLLFSFSTIRAEDNISYEIEQLICEKIDCNQIRLDIQYESKERLINIQKNMPYIANISLKQFDPSYKTFRASIIYDDDKSDEIYGRYDSFMNIPVASRLIRSGEVISQRDIINNEIKLARIKDSYITKLDDLIGKIAKKNILAGNIIKFSDVIIPAIIKQNDPVNIVYTHGNISLTATGIALSAGNMGEMIKVQNDSSGAILSGQIINKNTVHVGERNE